MLAPLDQTEEPFVASEAEAVIARTAVHRLQAVAETNQDIQIAVRDSPDVIVPLPGRAVKLILRLLSAMSNQIPISIIPHEAELTTQQAAEYLNVSRPFVTKLIDRGDITHRMVGRHRRIRFADLLDFEKRSKEARRQALAKMAAEAQHLELD